MVTNSGVLPEAPPVAEGKGSIPAAGRILEECANACRSFLAWEREKIFVGKPTPEEQEAHRRNLTWLLRITRLFYAVAKDPDFPQKSAVKWLEMWLWQLEQSWKTVYDPISEEEFQKVMATFPDNESRASGFH